jgi:glycerol-3-phosphate acyltransferase PlsY
MVAGEQHMSDALVVALVAGAYLLGSIPFGLILGKRQGVDVRDLGSGNIGASNVARNLGKKTGIVVLLLDALKAAGPTLLARMLFERGEIAIETLAAVALAGICGHCFSIWLKFRGGKGVATSLGVFLVIDPALAGFAILIFAGLYAAFRMVSLGSVSAAASFPVLLWVFERPTALVQLGIAVAMIIIIKHRSNLVRLFHHSENKL